MFGNERQKSETAGETEVSSKIDTLIGASTEITGDLVFSGGLHVDGLVSGAITAPDDSGSILTLSEKGTIHGEVRVPTVVINGTVSGDLFSSNKIELAEKSRIKGNVYYKLIEMAVGAELNGQLVHQGDEVSKVVPDKTRKGEKAGE